MFFNLCWFGVHSVRIKAVHFDKSPHDEPLGAAGQVQHWWKKRACEGGKKDIQI